MLERTLEYIREYFHILVRVGAEPPTRRDSILVYHPHTTKSPVLGILVIGKGKRVIGI